MSTTKESIDEAVQRVLEAAVQFREVEQDETNGTWTRALVWQEFTASLMAYHITELHHAAPTMAEHLAIEVDGEQVWCSCGYKPQDGGWGYQAQAMLVNQHVQREATK